MKKYTLLLLSSMLLLGCAETQKLSFPSHNQPLIEKISDVSWLDIEVPFNVGFDIDSQSQVLLNDLSAGPVAGFNLPGNRGGLSIEIASYTEKEKSVYAANVVVFNSKGDKIYQKSFDDFQYVTPKIIEPNKFVLNFELLPEYNGEDLKMLIYTRSKDLKEMSTILHPAKAFAKAKNTVPPNIADPKITHSLFGHFSIKVATNEVTSKYVAKNEYVPEGASGEIFYKEEIVKAVEGNDIPKALALLEEAKALNIEGAQEAFVNAINSKKK